MTICDTQCFSLNPAENWQQLMWLAGMIPYRPTPLPPYTPTTLYPIILCSHGPMTLSSERYQQ